MQFESKMDICGHSRTVTENFIFVMIMEPYILVILVIQILTRCNIFCLFGFYNPTCFGRSLRPSSGVILQNRSGSHWCLS